MALESFSCPFVEQVYSFNILKNGYMSVLQILLFIIDHENKKLFGSNLQTCPRGGWSPLRSEGETSVIESHRLERWSLILDDLNSMIRHNISEIFVDWPRRFCFSRKVDPNYDKCWSWACVFSRAKMNCFDDFLNTRLILYFGLILNSSGWRCLSRHHWIFLPSFCQ